jgi:gliding motility-associated-like protein
MKQLLATILLVITATFATYDAKASHQSAVDIYYNYVSPLTYEVHLIIYRDCSGIQNSPSEGMSAYSASLNQCINFTVDTVGISPNAQEVGDLCPNIPSQCDNPSSIFLGYQEWHYSGVIVLPAVAPDWYFIWTSCCRNSPINITGGSMGVWAFLNNVARPINNSPRLLVKPVPYVCVNQAQTYQNGPFDPDNDSVYFTNNHPLANASCNDLYDTIQYIGGYSSDSIITTTAAGPYIINPFTGAANFTPTIVGPFVLGFIAWDIDRFTFDTIGAIMRDVQINIVNCAAPPPLAAPVISTIGDTNKFIACPGTTINFQAIGISIAQSNNLFGSANNTITCPGSTITFTPNNGADTVVANFSWTPQNSDAGPHTLLITWSDSTCTVSQPLVLKAFTVIQIIVLEGVSAPDVTVCPFQDSVFIQGYAPPTMNQFNWSILTPTPGDIAIGSPTSLGTNVKVVSANFSGATFAIVLEGNPPLSATCPNKDTVFVTVRDSIKFNTNGPYNNKCVNDVYNMNITVSPNSVTGGAFQWSPTTYLSNPNSGITNCTPPGNVDYELYYTDLFGCKDTLDVPVSTVGVRPFVTAAASKNPVCPNEPIVLYAGSSGQSCGITTTPCDSGATNSYYQVGNGNLVNANFSPFYVSGINSGYRTQILYRIEDLKAGGMEPGNIKGLKFNVIANNNTNPLQNVIIKLGCTQLSELNPANGFVSGLSQVYTASSVTPTTGEYEIVIPAGGNYFWDGKSNLILELCYSTPPLSGGTPISVGSTLTSYNSVLTADANIGAAVPCNFAYPAINVNAVRANVKFLLCKTPPFKYAWTPAGLLSDPALFNPLVTNGISTNTVFTLTASDATTATCSASSIVNLWIDTSGIVTADVSERHLCYPGLVTLQASPVGNPPPYSCGATNYVTVGTPNTFNLGATAANGSSLIGLFNPGTAGVKMQYLVTKAELDALFGAPANTPFMLDQLRLNVTNLPTVTNFARFTINVACVGASLTGLAGLATPQFTTVYVNNNFNVLNGVNTFNFNAPYLWNGFDNLIVEICYQSPQPVFFGILDQYTTGGLNQMVVATTTSPGCDLPISGSFTLSQFNSKPRTTFRATRVVPRPFDYAWTGPSTAPYIYDSTKQNTLAYIPESGVYTVGLYNASGCLREDTVLVRLETHDVTVQPYDTTICPGDNFKAFVTGTGTGKYPVYQWLPTTGILCPTCTLTEVRPPSPIVYQIIRKDEFNCYDTATLDIKFYPKPNVVITNGDSLVIPINSEVALNAVGASIYSWAPTWHLNNPNIPNPLLQPQESGLYYAYGIDTSGCRNYDSIWIQVDPYNPIALPTVFSPNGDGRNDLFRVWNLREEKIQEFRVFNRFGNEVYNSIDNRGWDGRLNGKDCDMDTYTYIVRIAYANGDVKVRKGDVLLMR